MTKDEIKKLLHDVTQMADENDQIGYLEYDVKAMERYIRKNTDNKHFRIIKALSSTDRLRRPELRDDSAVVYFPSNSEHFKNRACIAIGLGMVADHYVHDSPFSDTTGLTTDIQRIVYFAQNILLQRSGILRNCALYRDMYALLPDQIPEKLHELLSHNGNKSDLSVDVKNRIDGFLAKIHEEMPDKGILDHSSQLVASYITTSHKIADVLISRKSLVADKLKRNKCTTHCYTDKFSIMYSEANDPLEQRVLIGHELGNIVCHWIPGHNGWIDETLDERKEATYFAKILLEYRAMLYLDGVNDSRYQDSCQKIANAIQKIYSGQPWLGWVLSD